MLSKVRMLRHVKSRIEEQIMGEKSKANYDDHDKVVKCYSPSKEGFRSASCYAG